MFQIFLVCEKKKKIILIFEFLNDFVDVVGVNVFKSQRVRRRSFDLKNGVESIDEKKVSELMRIIKRFGWKIGIIIDEDCLFL